MKSAGEEIRFLLDQVKRGLIDEAQAVKTLEVSRLAEILHPVIKASSVEGLPKWTGGSTGAPGAAVGRAYFSADALLEARERGILVLPASFAGDVEAIEAAAAVITAQGGYAAHASVVARQYGTVSLIAVKILPLHYPEFFQADRLNIFREMLLSESTEARRQRPMPSAPKDSARSASAGVSAFARTWNPRTPGSFMNPLAMAINSRRPESAISGSVSSAAPRYTEGSLS
ncbi:hypothetical protein AGMMS49944_30910 [Spirochaetia bacterium]|nr:hypothetical protein AGMMS49944_30910 [Spirochaetia bacterium]